MKTSKISVCLGIVALTGCNSDAPPDPSVAPVPVVAATSTPVPTPITIATLPPDPTPAPITPESLAISPTSIPTLGAEAQRAQDASRLGRISDLRREISEMERQKASIEERLRQEQNKIEERKRKSVLSDSSSDYEVSLRDEIRSLDGNIAGKQREIDRVMMSR